MASLSKICWQMRIPVIFITCVGFLFYIRIQKEDHIVESQNIAGRKYYLRLDDPFGGLREYVGKKGLL